MNNSPVRMVDCVFDAAGRLQNGQTAWTTCGLLKRPTLVEPLVCNCDWLFFHNLIIRLQYKFANFSFSEQIIMLLKFGGGGFGVLKNVFVKHVIIIVLLSFNPTVIQAGK